MVSWICSKINCEYVVRDRDGRVKATGATARTAVERAITIAARHGVRVRVVSGDRIIDPAAQGLSVLVECDCERCDEKRGVPQFVDSPAVQNVVREMQRESVKSKEDFACGENDR